MKKHHILLLLILPFLATLAVSCGSSRNTATLVKKSPVKGDAVSANQTVSIPQSLAPQSKALLKEASMWLGTPYKYGGSSRNGVDCSGFVTQVYLSALAIKLPRSSKEQSDYCTPTPKKELVPGDLLFFATGRSNKVSHVGIFIGDNRMIHASSSKGVIVSDITADYYTRTFTGSGRVNQYHAMISDYKEEPSLNEGIASNTPVVNEINISSIENNGDTPFNYTPVTSLPEKKVSNSPKTATVQSKLPATSPITPAKAAKSVVPEISADDARTSVLNSIIEQKLDSIYSN